MYLSVKMTSIHGQIFESFDITVVEEKVTITS